MNADSVSVKPSIFVDQEVQNASSNTQFHISELSELFLLRGFNKATLTQGEGSTSTLISKDLDKIATSKIFKNQKVKEIIDSDDFNSIFYNTVQTSLGQNKGYNEITSELFLMHKSGISADGTIEYINLGGSIEQEFYFQNKITNKTSVFYRESKAKHLDFISGVNNRLDEEITVFNYDEYFTTSFVQDIKSLDEGSMTYEDFFDIYGTHIVTNASFGGESISIYSVQTSSTDVSKELGYDFSTTIRAEVPFVVNVSSFSELGVKRVAEEYDLAVSVEGYSNSYGSLEYIHPEEGISTSALKNSDNSTMTLINKDVAIWEILPMNLYSNVKAQMEKEYKSYKTKLHLEYNKQHHKEYYLNDSNYDSIDGFLIRGEANLVQSNITFGEFVNQRDKVEIKDMFGYSLDELRQNGYDKITIVVTFYMREVEDGIQRVYLYNYYKHDVKYRVSSKSFEHYSGGVDVGWKKYTFEFEVSIDDLYSSSDHRYFYVRWGANGKTPIDYDNDWYCSELYVKVKLDNE